MFFKNHLMLLRFGIRAAQEETRIPDRSAQASDPVGFKHPPITENLGLPRPSCHLVLQRRASNWTLQSLPEHPDQVPQPRGQPLHSLSAAHALRHLRLCAGKRSWKSRSIGRDCSGLQASYPQEICGPGAA